MDRVSVSHNILKILHRMISLLEICSRPELLSRQGAEMVDRLGTDATPIDVRIPRSEDVRQWLKG
jgi:hypothetical protein